jgi:hypothetical protein
MDKNQDRILGKGDKDTDSTLLNCHPLATVLLSLLAQKSCETWIRIILGSWFRIRINVSSRIQIRITVNNRIQIRIKVMRIRNTAVQCGFLKELTLRYLLWYLLLFA